MAAGFGSSAPKLTSNDTSGEFALGLKGLPPGATTKQVFEIIQGFLHKDTATIVYILLHDDRTGKFDGNAKVTLSSRPSHIFWEDAVSRENGCNHTIARGNGYRPFVLRIWATFPKGARDDAFLAKYPIRLSLDARRFDVGQMVGENLMLIHHSSTGPGTTLTLDRKHRELKIGFNFTISDLTYPYTLNISLGQPCRILLSKMPNTDSLYSLVFQLETPPEVYRKFDPSLTHDDDAKRWSERNALYRQTELVQETKPATLRKQPLSLNRSGVLFDIGRWTTYRLVIDRAVSVNPEFGKMLEALRDLNMQILTNINVNVDESTRPTIWKFLENSTAPVDDSSLDTLTENVIAPLNFGVRYQLEVCISNGFLNEYTLSEEFVSALRATPAAQAKAMLELVAHEGKVVYDPMTIFHHQIHDLPTRPPILPHYCVYIHSAIITPTAVHYQTPVPDVSNRVIRQYIEYADRFLRVRFLEERLKGKIYATDSETYNDVFSRVKRILVRGIRIGERHYEFLAFGNSQFREHGAYFFCPLPHLNAAKIREWMGVFTNNKTVAKYAARLGQCFSTTRAIRNARVTLVEIPDIVGGPYDKYNFTDGCGYISKFLASLAADEVGVQMLDGEPPSVFQFRLGGAKGVLSVSPKAKDREIHIRPSQNKFAAKFQGLEVIRWSQFVGAHLNRQLIVIFSALGVADTTFLAMLQQQLRTYSEAMRDTKVAVRVLNKEVDANRMTLTLASILLDGFQNSQDPFAISLLYLWRAWNLKYLKEKAKLVVQNGAVLLGIADESRKLKGYWEANQVRAINHNMAERLDALPEVFVQISQGKDGKPEVITGVMAIARNPSLHPGDVRVVRGVDIEELHHLRDVLVLPVNGDRDLANMCSGGDLDGDDYVVIWDQALIPKRWSIAPMNYTPLQPVEKGSPITIDDISTFFVQYMKNDSLATIAHAHLGTADRLGVMHPDCIELAQLHSNAVDYAKSGQPADLPSRLRPSSWPHFMEKPRDKTYPSAQILGKIYDRIESVNFVPALDLKFDPRILKRYEHDPGMYGEIKILKLEYDSAVRRIMSQQEIRSEFEVWSTFVLSHESVQGDYKYHEVIGSLSTSLKERFTDVIYEKCQGRSFDHLAKYVTVMYKVTSDELDVFRGSAAWKEFKEEMSRKVVGRASRSEKSITRQFDIPLISFPWLFPSVLGRLARGHSPRPISEFAALLEAKVAGLEKLNRKRATYEEIEQKNALDDVLETAEGTLHKGDVLNLFDEETTNDEIGKGKQTGELVNPEDDDEKADTSASGGASLSDLTASNNSLNLASSSAETNIGTPLSRVSTPAAVPWQVLTEQSPSNTGSSQTYHTASDNSSAGEADEFVSAAESLDGWTSPVRHRRHVPDTSSEAASAEHPSPDEDPMDLDDPDSMILTPRAPHRVVIKSPSAFEVSADEIHSHGANRSEQNLDRADDAGVVGVEDDMQELEHNEHGIEHNTIHEEEIEESLEITPVKVNSLLGKLERMQKKRPSRR